LYYIVEYMAHRASSGQAQDWVLGKLELPLDSHTE
jgi:hypothetical protein